MSGQKALPYILSGWGFLLLSMLILSASPMRSRRASDRPHRVLGPALTSGMDSQMPCLRGHKSHACMDNRPHMLCLRGQFTACFLRPCVGLRGLSDPCLCVYMPAHKAGKIMAPAGICGAVHWRRSPVGVLCSHALRISFSLRLCASVTAPANIKQVNTRLRSVRPFTGKEKALSADYTGPYKPLSRPL